MEDAEDGLSRLGRRQLKADSASWQRLSAAIGLILGLPEWGISPPLLARSLREGDGLDLSKGGPWTKRLFL